MRSLAEVGSIGSVFADGFGVAGEQFAVLGFDSDLPAVVEAGGDLGDVVDVLLANDMAFGIRIAVGDGDRDCFAVDFDLRFARSSLSCLSFRSMSRSSKSRAPLLRPKERLLTGRSHQRLNVYASFIQEPLVAARGAPWQWPGEEVYGLASSNLSSGGWTEET